MRTCSQVVGQARLVKWLVRWLVSTIPTAEAKCFFDLNIEYQSNESHLYCPISSIAFGMQLDEKKTTFFF